MKLTKRIDEIKNACGEISANRAPLSLETGVLPALANRGRLAGVVCAGDFIDICIPPDYERAQQMLAALSST